VCRRVEGEYPYWDLKLEGLPVEKRRKIYALSESTRNSSKGVGRKKTEEQSSLLRTLYRG
jgi:hypothetical protein